MYCLTSEHRTEPFFLPDHFAWLEDHPSPLGCCNLPNSNLSSPQHSAKSLGKSLAAVKSRAACAEDSLEMQNLEVKELDTSPAQPPQPQLCPWCYSPAVQSGDTILYPSSPPEWHSCITRQEDAEHPWTVVATPPQLPVPLLTCLLAPVQMPRERHRTSPLPVTGKGQARC